MKIIVLITFLTLFEVQTATSQLGNLVATIVERLLPEDSDIRALINSVDGISRLLSGYSPRFDSSFNGPPNRWIKNFKLKRSYDFIIVGSGPAGSVIANRLSEIPEWDVLLIEVGDYETGLVGVPVLAPAFQYTKYNWEYYAEYQPNVCTGMTNQRMHWPRGRGLGGTSLINYMIYTRGNPVDYDNWAANGNPGWSYEDVFPYYMKSERARLQDYDPDIHNMNGNLAVEDIYKTRILDAFIEGGAELGLPHIDYNSPKVPFGVSRVQATVKRGRRHTAASSFLKPIRDRKNLHILHPAYVTEVLIDKNTREAYGVKCEILGQLYDIMASKEVILSAGAFNSPQLLMLSGIGPANHLQELGIEVLEDRPVGQNLHDHLTFPGLAFTVTSETLTISKVFSAKSFSDFLNNGTGPLTSLGGVQGIGYIKTEYSTEPGPQPDIELIFVGGTLASDFGLLTRRGMKITNHVYDGLLRPLHGKEAWTIFPMLLHPKSTGWMKLRSRNAKDYPLFYGNFLTDPEGRDVKTFIASIRFIQKLSNTKAFQRFDSKMNPNVHPGCEGHIFDSDAYWECCLRSIGYTLHHQVGTAKMGPKNDSTSVVDHRLKVHGINRLRVADCSIIPFALSAHTNAPSYMIGEKGADMIKEEWLGDFRSNKVNNVAGNEIRKRKRHH